MCLGHDQKRTAVARGGPVATSDERVAGRVVEKNTREKKNDRKQGLNIESPGYT